MSPLLFALGCGAGGGDAVAYEGDDVGECADGADNDRDGAYDCDDSDCVGSPDCDTASPADTDTGASSGGGGGAGGGGAGGGGDTGMDTDTAGDSGPTDSAAPWEGVHKVADVGRAIVGDRYHDMAGWSVAVGDLDEDGDADVLLGGPSASRPDFGDGAAWAVFGPIDEERSLAAADVTIDPSTTAAYFGMSVAIAGELDGDGHTHVAIGAPGTSGGLTSGAVYLYATPLSPTLTTDDAEAVWEGESAGAEAGWALWGGVDFTGDGVDDLAVGAPGDSDQVGAAYILSGAVSGGGTLDEAGVRIYGDGSGGSSKFGSDVYSVGDVDGDGNADLGVGWFGFYQDGVGYPGAIAVFFGPLSGHPGAADADARVVGDTTFTYVGLGQGSAQSVGDMDGDGTPDLVLGTPYGSGADSSMSAGAVYVFSGSAVAAGTDTRLADAEVTSTGLNRYLGTGVTAVGDVDGDGRADVVVGKAGDYTYAASGGASALFYGPMSGDYTIEDAAALWYGDADQGLSGWSDVGGADLTGDGRADLLVAAPGAAGDADGAGMAYVVPGA